MYLMVVGYLLVAFVLPLALLALRPQLLARCVLIMLLGVVVVTYLPVRERLATPSSHDPYADGFGFAAEWMALILLIGPIQALLLFQTVLQAIPSARPHSPRRRQESQER